MTPRTTTLVLLGILAAASHAGTDGARSPNGRFGVAIDSWTRTHYVYRSDGVENRLWTFQHAVQGPFLVSDDGETVVVVGSEYVRVDDLDMPALTFYGRNGRFRSYTYRELGTPRRTQYGDGSPTGSYWRVWYEQISGDGSTLHLVTAREATYTFSMANGAMLERRFRFSARMAGIGALWLLACAGLVAWRRRKRKPAVTPVGSCVAFGMLAITYSLLLLT